jgi:hypothetical protein
MSSEKENGAHIYLHASSRRVVEWPENRRSPKG